MEDGFKNGDDALDYEHSWKARDKFDKYGRRYEEITKPPDDEERLGKDRGVVSGDEKPWDCKLGKCFPTFDDSSCAEQDGKIHLWATFKITCLSADGPL